MREDYEQAQEAAEAQLSALKAENERQENALFDCRTRHEFALERIDSLEAEPKYFEAICYIYKNEAGQISIRNLGKVGESEYFDVSRHVGETLYVPVGKAMINASKGE